MFRVPKPIFSITADLETSIVPSHGGMDVPLADRRFLLIPIEGCGEGIDENGGPITLEQWQFDHFSEDVGFTPHDRMLLKRLEVGVSFPITDGIAQLQTIVRIV